VAYAGVAAIVAGGLAAGTLLGSLTREQPTSERSPLYSVKIPSSSRQVGVPLQDAGCSEVQEPKVQPSQVVVPDEEHEPYSSTPPTSGAHYAVPMSPAIYWAPDDPEAAVANLAVGDVVVWHSGFDTLEEQNEMKGLFVYFRSEDILAVPGDDLGLRGRIVLTAWGKLQVCEEFSGEAIHRFFDEYRGQGPGYVPPV
jgi:hypothetical protein